VTFRPILTTDIQLFGTLLPSSRGRWHLCIFQRIWDKSKHCFVCLNAYLTEYTLFLNYENQTSQEITDVRRYS